MSGTEALPHLRSHWPRAELLVFTVDEDEADVFAALRAGAIGYMIKTTPPAALVEAIRDAYSGGAPMSASVARQVVQAFKPPDPGANLLSARERDVLKALMEGKTYRQIGSELLCQR